MTVMRVTLAAASALVAGVVLAGCGSATGGAGGGGGSAASPSTSMSAPRLAVPPADGPVTGQGTVIEVPEKGPELCLGPVMESFPPQCEGIPLAGWTWKTGSFEDGSSVGNPTKWGTYAVTGTFDGLTVTVTSSIPLALHDTVAPPSPRPMAPPDLSAEEWAAIETGVRVIPGMLTSMREGDQGPVLVEVVHDDGTLQDWADQAFGVGAVRLTSMLR
ncbi:hypothetical protein [Oryzobacter telluris]|uniref:hypothetical protein n=1 Tax=Oryzobacter telluris TaxID=3149179 RepID=UPI00370DD9C4